MCCFFSGLNPQAAMVAKRMKALGMKTQFVGGGGVVSGTFVTVAGPAAEGAMACEYGSPLANLPNGIAFEKKYQDKFGETMLPYAAFAYDATWMSIKAMQAANSAKDQVFVPKLHSLTYAGVTGDIQFSEQGALKNPTSTMYTVKDGKWVPIVAAR